MVTMTALVKGSNVWRTSMLLVLLSASVATAFHRWRPFSNLGRFHNHHHHDPALSAILTARGGFIDSETTSTTTTNLADCHVVTVLTIDDGNVSSLSLSASASDSGFSYRSFLLPLQHPNTVHEFVSFTDRVNSTAQSSIPTTLAWMSDTLVIHILVKQSSLGLSLPQLPRSLLMALRQGMQRKTTLPYSPTPPNLLILLQEKQEDDDVNNNTTSSSSSSSLTPDQRHTIRQHVLAQCDMIHPRHVQAFEVFWEEDPKHTITTNRIHALAKADESIHTMTGVQDVPLEGFPLWMQQIHASLVENNGRGSSSTTRLFQNTWTTRSVVSHQSLLRLPSESTSIVTTQHHHHQQQQQQQQQQASSSISQSDDPPSDEEHQVLYHKTIQWVDTELETLETQLEEYQLLIMDQSTTTFDFGTPANALLDAFFIRQKQITSVEQRDQAQKHTGQKMRLLYQSYLQVLRNRYGQVYEALLDQLQQQSITTDQERKRAEQSLNQAIAEISERFRQDAIQATPTLANLGGVFRDMDLEYASTLQQLLQDFQSSTELWMLGQSTDAMVEGEDEDEVRVFHQRIPKWVKKVGARVLVLAVNYVQGWLAWQGIQRAALERERNFPKFPIF